MTRAAASILFRPVAIGALVAILALGPAARPAWAFGDGRDADQPINIDADHSEADRAAGTAIFTGRVEVVQGVNCLKCDKLTVYYRSKSQAAAAPGAPAPGPKPASKAAGAKGDEPVAGLYKLDAEGSVFLSSPDETAQGSRAIYDVEHKQITMTGTVVLTRGKNVLRGTNLVIETATGKSRMDSEKNGRVKGLFIPEDKGAKPAGEGGKVQ